MNNDCYYFLGEYKYLNFEYSLKGVGINLHNEWYFLISAIWSIYFWIKFLLFFLDTTSISSNSNQSRMTTTPGPSSVSSSGYPASPAIITLDSPSPPRSPQSVSQNQQNSSCLLQSTNGSLNQQNSIYNPHMPFLDLEGETNSANINTYHQF